MNPKFNIGIYHKKFRKFAVKSFAFLVKKFNFKIVKEAKEPYVFSYRITYKNPTTAIKISYDVRDEGISVLIYRLVNNEIPGYPLFISKKTIINCYYLDDVIEIKSLNPDEEFYTIRHVKEFPPIYDDKTIANIVSEYARALEKYASDVLSGDFKIFSELEKIVKKRAEKIAEEDALR